MAHSSVSDLGPHCLPITLLQVSRLQWVTVSHETAQTDANIFL